MMGSFLSLQGDVDGENAEPNDRKVSYYPVYTSVKWLLCEWEKKKQNQIVSAIKQLEVNKDDTIVTERNPQLLAWFNEASSEKS